MDGSITGGLDASKPLVLAGGAPSGGFFSAKKASENQIMRIYYEIGVFVRFSQKNLIVYHDLDHDKQHLCASPPARPPAVFFQKKVSKKLIMRIYKKRLHLCVFQEN